MKAIREAQKKAYYLVIALVIVVVVLAVLGVPPWVIELVQQLFVGAFASAILGGLAGALVTSMVGEPLAKRALFVVKVGPFPVSVTLTLLAFLLLQAVWRLNLLG